MKAPNIALVYHEREVDYLARLKTPEHPDSDPVLVAIVSCESTNHEVMLEEAFTCTNTIESDWRHNTNVLSTNLLRNSRSTSVGDYVQIGMHVYRCDPIGWTHVAPTRWQLIKSLLIGV